MLLVIFLGRDSISVRILCLKLRNPRLSSRLVGFLPSLLRSPLFTKDILLMAFILDSLHTLNFSLFSFSKLLLRHTVIADEIEVYINLLRGLHGSLSVSLMNFDMINELAHHKGRDFIKVVIPRHKIDKPLSALAVFLYL